MNGFKLLESYVKIGERGFVSVNRKIAALRRSLSRVPDSATVRVSASGLDAVSSQIASLRNSARRPIPVSVDTSQARTQIRDLSRSFDELAALGGSRITDFIPTAEAISPALNGFRELGTGLGTLGARFGTFGTRVASLFPRLAGLALRLGSIATAIGAIATGPLGLIVGIFGAIGIAAFAAFRGITSVLGVIARLGGAVIRPVVGLIGSVLSSIVSAFAAVARTVGRVGGLLVGTISRALGSILGTLGRIVGTVGGLLGVTSAVALIVGGLRELNNLQVESAALRSLVRDANETNRLFREFTNLGERFGDVPGFRRAGRVLLALGSDANQVREELLRINDIAAATGNRFQDVSRIYTQIRTKNQLYAEEIQQLGDRGIPIVNELARVLGVNQRQVRNLAEQGKIDFAEFLRAFNSLTNPGGRFFESAIAQSETLFAQLRRIRSTLQLAAGTALLALGNVFQGIVDQGRILGSVVTQIAERFARTRIDAGFLDNAVQNVFLFGARVLDTFTNVGSVIRSLVPSSDSLSNAFARVGAVGASAYDGVRNAAVEVISVTQAIVRTIQSSIDVSRQWLAITLGLSQSFTNLFSSVSAVAFGANGAQLAFRSMSLFATTISANLASIPISIGRSIASAANLGFAFELVLSVVRKLKSFLGDVVDFQIDTFSDQLRSLRSQNASLAKSFEEDFIKSADNAVAGIQSRFAQLTRLTAPGAFTSQLGELSFTSKAEDKALLARSNGIIAANTAAITANTESLRAPQAILRGSAEFSQLQARQLTQQLNDSAATRDAMERTARLQAQNNTLVANASRANQSGQAAIADALSGIQTTQVPVASLFE